MKKIVTLGLTAVMALGMVACGDRRPGNESEVEVDQTKTQLYVGAYEGGYGQGWLDNYARAFEKFYENEEFEEGKKGVQVIVDLDSQISSGVSTVMRDLETEVFFVEMGDYYQLVNGGFLLDITDAVTEPLTEFGENQSIYDKMYDADKKFFNVEDGENAYKFYAVPSHETTYGIIYDIDMFEENGFYLAAEGYGNSQGFLDPYEDVDLRSDGPDGEHGTADDGLPATYEEFFKLCDYIAGMEMFPITWTGKHQGYVNNLMMSLWADYEGVENMSVNYNFNDTVELVESINQDGTVKTYEQAITPSNGYLLQKQAGKYYALKFIEQLISKPNEYYNSNLCYSNAQTQMMAQTNFLQSRFDREIKDVAMLIDGTFWFNEAHKTFEEMKNTPGASASERKLGILPLPKATEDKLGQNTFYSAYLTELCVKSNIAPSKIECAKQFVRFVRTNKQLSAFTADTSTAAPYNYTLEAADEARISFWGKQVYNQHVTSQKVYPWSKQKVYLADTKVHLFSENAWLSNVGNDSYNLVTKAFQRSKTQTPPTAKQYFEGLSAYTNESYWNNKYGAYLN